MAGTDVCLPMLATDEPAPISLERMKQIMTQLSAPGQQRKLATDVSFLKQQAELINEAAGHLREAFSDDQACRQLLEKAPQTLRQLAVITKAVLQQLTAQHGSEVEVSRTAGLLAASLVKVLQVIGRKPADIQTTPALAGTIILCMLHETGLLNAYAAAAQAAISFLANDPQLPRAEPGATAPQAALQLFDPPHVFAAASNSLLVLWNTLVRFVPSKELLSAQSLLQDTALPAAALAMALARAYVRDDAFCVSVMWDVLATSCYLAAAAATGPADASCSVLACQEVYELLLLGLAVGTGLLHAEYKGTSAQALLTSLRTTGSTTTRGSSSRGSGSKHVVVSAHHQELLQALLGVRQLPALHELSAEMVGKQMWCIPMAVVRACRTRYMDAHGMGDAASSTLSRTSAGAKEAVRSGELVPWPLALPLLLTQVQLLALAPPTLAEQPSVLQQMLEAMIATYGQIATYMQRWQLGQQHPNFPSLEVMQSQMQLCLESVWLQLGPVLLSLCRRSSGEAVEEGEGRPCWVLTDMEGQPLGVACPRAVFESCGQLLIRTLVWHAAAMNVEVPGGRSPAIDLAAVVEQNPLLACSLVEAALHASIDYSDPPGSDNVAAAEGRLHQASTTCFGATVAIQVLASAVHTVIAARAAAAEDQAAATPTAAGATTGTEAAEGQQAAAAAHAHGSSRLEQKLFCVLIAALKYAQVSGALQGSGTAALGCYYYALALLCICSSAAVLMFETCSQLTLCDDSMPASALPVAAAGSAELHSERVQQLVWLHMLGRLLIAAGQLLQQVPQRMTASGEFVLADNEFPEPKQFAGFSEIMAALLQTTAAFDMFGVLRQDAATAAAVAAGTAAAATQADLKLLLQQATALQKQVMTVEALFEQSFDYGVQGMQQQERSTRVQALQQLHAVCQEGGLPQQLCSFGVAYCVAFPTRGCCGNPGCINLDKFTETALASQGCSGCSKAVKFCSAACHKRAWKQGHKAACAILKQRQAAAEAPAAHEGV